MSANLLSANQAPHSVSMADLESLAERLERLNEAVKSIVFKPEGQKESPLFNAAQLAAYCGKSPDAMARLLERALDRGLPDGVSRDETGTSLNRRTRVFSVADVRMWVKASRPAPIRPAGARAATVTVANFKGGVGKTTVAMSLAQGLSLRGARVLCIDFDPQGSLSALCGLTPSDILESQTVMPLMVPREVEYASDSLEGIIRPTYWDGIDLVPATDALFNAEFYLPTRQMKAQASGSGEPAFEFWEVLNKALDLGPRDVYDYIIVDTPPALSYMTMTTFWAADALLMPLPPEGLDFASSARFWAMLADLSDNLSKGATAGKTYAWVGTVPSKVNHTNLHTKEMLKWMQTGYQGLLMRTEIPETAAVRVGGMKLATVYDISRYVGSQKTLLRAREAFDKLVEEVDFLTHQTLWARGAGNTLPKGT